MGLVGACVFLLALGMLLYLVGGGGILLLLSLLLS